MPLHGDTHPTGQLPRLRGPQVIGLRRLLRLLATRQDLWGPYVRFDAAHRHAARVASTADYEVWLLTWLPGQGTRLHDHGGSAGGFAVISGYVIESTLSGSRGRGGPSLVGRHLGPGRTRAFGPDHVHDLSNTGVAPAVTLHAYAPALESMRRLTLGDDGEPRTLTVERLGVDW